jgi:hypothetical protein
MLRLAMALAIGTIIGGGSPGFARQADPLPVRIEGPPGGPQYVGQAIPIRVLVTAEGTEPTIDPPIVDDLDVIPGPIEVRPISASSIGTIVQETNLYRFTFGLVPRKSGALLVPSFRARVDGRSGAAEAFRLEPRQPPSGGRPSWFLGGVGPLEVGLIARPEAIRLGDSAVVEVRLEGPGALGSTIRPTFRVSDRDGSPVTVEPMPATSSNDPPSRVFPFRVRPISAGGTTIEPVLVSWFDPGSRGYRTVSSRGVSIRVEDPPEFDPSAVEVAMIEDAPGGNSLASGRLGRAIGAIGAAGVIVMIAWRWDRRRRRSPARYARHQARRIEASHGPDRADLVAEALAGYLRRAIDRPEGELTPPEAREAIGEATGDPELSDRAARLVVGCDAARYSGRADEDGLENAAELFRELARARRPEASKEGRTIDGGRP